MSDTENLKRRLQQTELAYQSALAMSQFKSEYLGKIAHELRSPISSMMGLHQLIISDLCENQEEEREFVVKAYEYAKKIIGLIDQVVEISKIESGTIELNLTSLKLTDIFTEVYTRTYLQVANRNLKLVIPNLDSNLYVIGDERKLLQCLVNLVDIIVNNAESGLIVFDVSQSFSENFLTINIDTPVAMNIWSESPELKIVDFKDIKKTLSPPQFSPHTKMMLSKTLLESMGGNFQIRELSPQNHTKSLTQLQCLLPCAS